MTVARVKLARVSRRSSAVLFVVTTGLVVIGSADGEEAFAGPASGNEGETADAGQDASTDPNVGPDGGHLTCPTDMVEVSGDYCADLHQHCLRWIKSEPGAERCAEFAPHSLCRGTATKKHFCIDRYEYPNRKGDKPAVMKTWTEGQDLCRAIGKRLCGDSEWTLACEGRRRLAYPYGNKRDAKACNIDKTLPAVDQVALADPKRAAAETARLWQGEPSGSRAACVSPYGAFDMTGNVDEWVVNESGKPFASGLKGGYWGPVRARCRPMTTGHGETFPFYETGFRCCADTK